VPPSNSIDQARDYRFAIKTPSGVKIGDAGDYMLQDEQGDQWAVPAAKFPSVYTKQEEII
jgi:hypothetical protein